jgi:hypothetical protein
MSTFAREARSLRYIPLIRARLSLCYTLLLPEHNATQEAMEAAPATLTGCKAGYDEQLKLQGTPAVPYPQPCSLSMRLMLLILARS